MLAGARSICLRGRHALRVRGSIEGLEGPQEVPEVLRTADADAASSCHSSYGTVNPEQDTAATKPGSSTPVSM